ncbi:MAG: acetyl-CoA carboxylase biotin carboxyl carrier protein subunit [Odoribacter sp.]|nr:acetyl-CoA carboxylase biotin carboxyl carrier protein subunit [Odoribacter sp.]
MKEYKYKINGNPYKVAIGDIEDNIANVEVNGVAYRVEIEASKAAVIKTVQAPRPSAAPRTATGDKVIAKPQVAGSSKAVKAPLPGVVLSIPVKVGQAVKAADTVLLLEAMKMENAIHAGSDGVVKEILVNAGDSVLEGNPLIVIE